MLLQNNTNTFASSSVTMQGSSAVVLMDSDSTFAAEAVVLLEAS